MFYRTMKCALATALMFMAQVTYAAAALDQALVDKIRGALDSRAMGLTVASVEASKIPGLYQVQFKNGPLVYSNAEGSYFIAGDLFAVNNGQFVNLAEQRGNGKRLAQLNTLDESDMIVFAPEGEVRAEISVFTDVTCFYCQKLHKEVPELNKRGVKVRYLAYPRSGLNTPGYRQLVSAWCASDRKKVLTQLKNKQSVPEISCDNPVAAQYQLGQQMGVRGTPAMVTETGQMIPGYQSADQLMTTLGLN